MNVLRVAIVGAGPAGIYAADILNKAEKPFDVSIDLFDRLPAPYGLVRYGVAPDHPRIKGVVSALRDVLDHGDIRYFGNVNFGIDFTLDDIRDHYHAVIFATGAIRDASLNIPGIDLTGSFGAADFVNWYDGHPDVGREWTLDAESVAVIGNGNVALDVARILAKPADALLSTEIPQNVYEGLAASSVKDVHVFGRRGPAFVKFTPIELRELGEQPEVELVLNEADFADDDASDAAVASSKQVLMMKRIMTAWRERGDDERLSVEAGTAQRKLHLHFWNAPIEVLGDDAGRVRALRVERTSPVEGGGTVGTGEFHDVPVQQLYRAIGYFGSPLHEIPFDERRGVIPNIAGRVVDSSGDHLAGLYTTGWIKRGPVGLIGHTKSDAMETIRSLVDDQGARFEPGHSDPDAILALLHERGVEFTDLDGWHALDEHEKSLGEPHGRERVKVVEREHMVDISRAASSVTAGHAPTSTPR